MYNSLHDFDNVYVKSEDLGLVTFSIYEHAHTEAKVSCTLTANGARILGLKLIQAAGIADPMD